MKLTPEVAKNIVFDDYEGWEKVEGTEEIVDQGRWETTFSAVKHCLTTDKYYKFYWNRGSTECQDAGEPYEYEKEVDVNEVELKEVLVKEWVKV